MSDPNVLFMLDVIEERMKGALAQSRAMFAHMGIRGGYVESEFREVLAKHLSRSLTVGTGEVIDLNGVRSGQMDVLVANQEQPFGFETHEPGVYIVEGVSAAGEIKSKLTTSNLADAIEHGAKFKALRNLPMGQSTPARAMPEDLRRFHDCPPFFVFAFESEVAPETLIGQLAAAEPVRVPGSPIALSPIDAVFVPDHGLAVDFGNGHGAHYSRIVVDGVSRRVSGWMWKNSGSVFGDFMLWLHTVMPRTIHHAPVSPRYLVS